MICENPALSKGSGTALAMTAQLIDGHKLAAEVKNQVRG